jgi:molecular chaperone GrpE
VSDINEKSPNSNGIEDTQKVEVDTIAAERAKLQEQADKFRNEYLYLRAEFENYKKNSIKERSDLMKFGAERLARDIVGVLDNFERALSLKITPENLR